MSANIVIIEDNEPNLELMSYLLKAHGYSPLAARDGEEGLELVRRERPDLIICDLNIPKRDGFEVGRNLKSDPELRRTILVAVTALAMVGDREKVLSAGFDGYIAKPIAPQKFVAELEAFLAPALRSGHNPATDRSRPEPVASQIKKAAILLIDDMSANLLLGSSILEPRGYEVIPTRNPEEAATLAVRHGVKVILTDMKIGDKTAYDVLRLLRVNAAAADIPVLVVSSSIHSPLERAGLLAGGARAVLNRPVDPRRLLAEVEYCLQEGR